MRTPRPVASKLTADTPLLTRQCVPNALFPSVLGKTCAIHGDFCCGVFFLIDDNTKKSKACEVPLEAYDATICALKPSNTVGDVHQAAVALVKKEEDALSQSMCHATKRYFKLSPSCSPIEDH